MKAIIFDWGRTLHDPDGDGLFDGVSEMIAGCAKQYKLTLVSLAKSQDPETRKRVIGESGIAEYFDVILVGDEGKDDMYEEALRQHGVDASEVVVVDDRVVRGITWANKRGASSVWVRQGKFADELPNEETGEPTLTITHINTLLDSPLFV